MKRRERNTTDRAMDNVLLLDSIALVLGIMLVVTVDVCVESGILCTVVGVEALVGGSGGVVVVDGSGGVVVAGEEHVVEV